MDYLVTMAPGSGGGYIRQQVNIFWTLCWKQKKWASVRMWATLTRGQIVLARRPGQSISRTAALVGCSRSAAVRTDQKWSKEGEPGQTRGSLMHVGSEGWPVLSDPIEELLELKLMKKLMLVLIERCQNTQSISVCCVWGTGQGARADPCPPTKSASNGAREHQNWTTEQWKKVARSDESRFLLHHVDGNELEVLTRPPNSPDLWSNGASVGCSGQTSPIHGGPTSLLTGLKGSGN